MSEAQLIAEIDKLDRLQMAELWRSAPIGHRFFSTSKRVGDHFVKRFKKLGGMSPEISKKLGW